MNFKIKGKGLHGTWAESTIDWFARGLCGLVVRQLGQGRVGCSGLVILVCGDARPATRRCTGAARDTRERWGLTEETRVAAQRRRSSCGNSRVWSAVDGKRQPLQSRMGTSDRRRRSSGDDFEK
jgi:hypothetical protein